MKIFAFIVITVLAIGAQACTMTLGNHGHIVMACNASYWTGILTAYACRYAFNE